MNQRKREDRKKRKPSDYIIIVGLFITFIAGGGNNIPIIIATGITGLTLLTIGAVLSNAK